MAVWTCATIAQTPAQPSIAPQQPASTTEASANPTPPPSPDIPKNTESVSSLSGLPVRDIQFRSPAVRQPDELLKLIPQKAAEPLDKLKLRRSIQELYATGRFADIQVEADRTPDNELSLVFIAKENYFVDRVSALGTPRGGPTDHQLINASKFELGQLYTEDKLQRSLEAMKRVMEDGGYYRSHITVEFAKHPNTQLIDILFRVVPGEQARVGQVTVIGRSGMPSARLAHVAKLESGDRVNLNRVNRALERLRKHFQKEDRLEAQVSVSQRVYNGDNNTVDYVFNVVRGPLVNISIAGAKLPRGAIKRYVPVYEENAVDADLLNEGSRNLRDYFQTQGYFDVDVSYQEKAPSDGSRVDITYDVDRHERHRLVGVVIDGNDYFSDELIRSRMSIQPANLLLRHGVFSTDMLNRDAQSITELYRSSGFQDVKVRTEVDDDYEGVKGHMRVVLHIEEGPQTRVRTVKLEGVKTFSVEDLLLLLSNADNQPFSDANVASDRDEITNYYFNRGFPSVDFESKVVPVEGDPTRVDVTYTITEGSREYVDQVYIRGAHYTKRYVVHREVRIHKSDPLSQADMLETQSRLYDLGIFSGVDIGVQNPDGKEPSKNVMINLYEAPRYTIDYGLGFEVQTGAPVGSNPQGQTGASPRATFDITRNNFLGRDHTVYFKSHVGRLQQRVLLSYEAPKWMDKENLKLTFNGFYDNSHDVTTFTSSRLEGSVQAQQTLNKATILQYRFSYRLVKVDASTLVIDPNLIPLLSRPERIGIPSFTFLRDTRDNPIESHKGRLVTVDAGVSSRVFGSEASFARVLVQHSAYHSFYRGKYVLAYGTKMGFEPPFGAVGALIPLPERFFAGGGNTLRGFSINQAGPRDHETGFPIGGESMFVNNIELRFPPMILPLFGNSVSPVLFHDMGNVFAASSDLFRSLARVTQKNKAECQLVSASSTCSLNYLSHAIGGGLRYKTPIGPVRLDMGYNLNPPTFPIRSESRSLTLRRVNFFFSIGQTF